MRLLAYLGRENPRAGCGPRAETAESAKRAELRARSWLKTLSRFSFVYSQAPATRGKPRSHRVLIRNRP